MVPSMVLHCTVPCHAAWACDNTRPPHTHTKKKTAKKKGSFGGSGAGRRAKSAADFARVRPGDSVLCAFSRGAIRRASTRSARSRGSGAGAAAARAPGATRRAGRGARGARWCGPSAGVRRTPQRCARAPPPARARERESDGRRRADAAAPCAARCALPERQPPPPHTRTPTHPHLATRRRPRRPSRTHRRCPPLRPPSPRKVRAQGRRRAAGPPFCGSGVANLLLQGEP